jgi:hypothetical protein
MVYRNSGTGPKVHMGLSQGLVTEKEWGGTAAAPFNSNPST